MDSTKPNINPRTGLCDCPMCASTVEMNATATLEGYYDWQTCYIRCPNEKCGMELNLTADFWHLADDSWGTLRECWNRLCQKQ